MKKRYSINDFRLATPEEVSTHFEGHAILLHPKNIVPYYVYKFLKERYGPPNIPSEVHSEPHRVSWEYVLKGPRSFIAIHDWKYFSWSFSIRLSHSLEKQSYEQLTKQDDEARKDARIILNEMMQYFKKQKKQSHQDESIEPSYQYLQNIYLHHYSCGDHLLSLYEKPKNNLNLDPILAEVRFSVDIEDRYVAWASALSFVLSVEGLFNLIYEIYLNPEIASDEHLRNHVYHMSLADRWLTFSLFCSCFLKSLDRKSKGFENLSKLIKIRNYWAHSNIGEDQRNYIIEEDGLEFGVIKESEFWELSSSNIDFYKVKKIRERVDRIKLEILNAMKPNDKQSFSKVLDRGTIILDKEGKLVIYD